MLAAPETKHTHTHTYKINFIFNIIYFNNIYCISSNSSGFSCSSWRLWVSAEVLLVVWCLSALVSCESRRDWDETLSRTSDVRRPKTTRQWSEWWDKTFLWDGSGVDVQPIVWDPTRIPQDLHLLLPRVRRFHPLRLQSWHESFWFQFWLNINTFIGCLCFWCSFTFIWCRI